MYSTFKTRDTTGSYPRCRALILRAEIDLVETPVTSCTIFAAIPCSTSAKAYILCAIVRLLLCALGMIMMMIKTFY